MDLRQRYGPPSYVYLCVFDVYLRYGPPSLMCILCVFDVYLRRAHTNSKYTQIQRWSGRRHFQAKMGTIWSCVYLGVFAHGTNTMCICLYLIVSDGKSSFKIQTVFAV